MKGLTADTAGLPQSCCITLLSQNYSTAVVVTWFTNASSSTTQICCTLVVICFYLLQSSAVKEVKQHSKSFVRTFICCQNQCLQ